MAEKVELTEYSDNYLQKWPLEAPILQGFWRGTVEMNVPRCRGLTPSRCYLKNVYFVSRNGSSPMKGIDIHH